MDQLLKGQAALVTGAAKGLGLETARQLHELGATVILTGRDLDRLERAQAQLEGGGDVFIHELDVTDPASVDAIHSWANTRIGPLHILINNAGRLTGGYESGLQQSSVETITETIDNNALGAWRLMQKFVPAMNENGYGRIVNVTSGMGSLTDMGSHAVPYRVSKTVLNALTLLASREAGANVKINAVCPGWVRTDMGGPNATRDLPDGARGIVWAATLDHDGPNGGLFRDGKPLAW